jgi:hypothetical protein
MAGQASIPRAINSTSRIAAINALKKSVSLVNILSPIRVRAVLTVLPLTDVVVSGLHSFMFTIALNNPDQ